MLHETMPRRRVGAILSAAALAWAAAACLAPGAFAADMRVKIDNFTFAPATLTVPVGTTVVFENDDDVPHLVVATDKTFRSKALDTGDTFSLTLTRAGEIDYFCGLHPHMTGKIVVTP